MKKVICGIYKITSPTGKVYVGQSINIKRRIWYYKRMLCIAQTKIYHSIKKHGWDNHLFEILIECSPQELNNLEVFYIKKFNSFNSKHGLNLLSGGEASKASDETKLKQSIRMRHKYKEDKNAYEKLVAQITSIDRKGEKNPKYGTGMRVMQFTKDLKFIREYISATEVCKVNSYTNTSGIYSCCHRVDKCNTYKGYVWRFKHDCLIENGFLKEKILFRKLQKGKTTPFKGVSLALNGKWKSRWYDPEYKKYIHLGMFDTQENAARAINVYLRDFKKSLVPLYEIPHPFNVVIVPNKPIVTRCIRKNRFHQYECRIVYKKKHIYVGGFYNMIDAVAAYNKKALELYGNNAKLNKIA